MSKFVQRALFMCLAGLGSSLVGFVALDLSSPLEFRDGKVRINPAFRDDVERLRSGF